MIWFEVDYFSKIGHSYFTFCTIFVIILLKIKKKVENGGNIVKNCTLQITSTVDGQENVFSTKGKIDLSVENPKICYWEENSVVRLTFQGETARVEREGDYSLKINLERDVMQKGSLGIGGQEGEICAYAHKVTYTISENSLLALLHYDLWIGGEPQQMQLRVLARTI